MMIHDSAFSSMRGLNGNHHYNEHNNTLLQFDNGNTQLEMNITKPGDAYRFNGSDFNRNRFNDNYDRFNREFGSGMRRSGNHARRVRFGNSFDDMDMDYGRRSFYNNNSFGNMGYHGGNRFSNMGRFNNHFNNGFDNYRHNNFNRRGFNYQFNDDMMFNNNNHMYFNMDNHRHWNNYNNNDMFNNFSDNFNGNNWSGSDSFNRFNWNNNRFNLNRARDCQINNCDFMDFGREHFQRFDDNWMPNEANMYSNFSGNMPRNYNCFNHNDDQSRNWNQRTGYGACGDRLYNNMDDSMMWMNHGSNFGHFNDGDCNVNVRVSMGN